MKIFDTYNYVNRIIGCNFLAFATYNTSGYSYYHWITEPSEFDLPLKVFVGIMLLIVFGVGCQATWRSMGAVGTALTMMVYASVVWTLVDYRWIDFNDESAVANCSAFIIGTTLGSGLSWSHQRVRWCGQVDAKDVNQY